MILTKLVSLEVAESILQISSTVDVLENPHFITDLVQVALCAAFMQTSFLETMVLVIVLVPVYYWRVMSQIDVLVLNAKT